MFEGYCDGGFSRGGESGEPDCQTVLVTESGADRGCQGCWMIGDVSVEGWLVGLGLGIPDWGIGRSTWIRSRGNEE